MTDTLPALLLASSSPARRELLARLGLPFTSASPDVDETPLPGEDTATLVQRLSEAKALALAAKHAGLIIGSDQALTIDGETLGKPGNHEKAVEQLRRLSGRDITFHTGLCLLNTVTGRRQTTVEPFTVSVRPLSTITIERYLLREQPYQCAGSFMCEGLGITLFRQFRGRDPNSLIGLPLMALTDFLLNEGIPLP